MSKGFENICCRKLSLRGREACDAWSLVLGGRGCWGEVGVGGEVGDGREAGGAGWSWWGREVSVVGGSRWAYGCGRR